ncbi:MULTISPECIES: ribosome hibernation-promoting factor, HPF/YfiA family [Jonquetella]|nr:ribosome-associated translation inhibitor RaiA [Jonquetella anthropi]ERL24285.1 ribosomal subunit interface protein [Jonquetella sp. BV3C21]
MMDIRFTTHNAKIPAEMKEYMEGKLGRMEKFFSRILDMQVAVKTDKKDFVTVEITADANGVVLRGEQRDPDLRKAFDLALKVLERRIRRHKEYLIDRAQLKAHDVSFGYEDTAAQAEPESSYSGVRIEREKVVEPHPMTAKEAALQMELLGHSFFIFVDTDSGHPALVYRREAGGYGLLKIRA